MAEDWLSLPIAIALSDEALEFDPDANASLPEALDSVPKAIELSPLADAPLPNAEA
nr:hypothetical protein [Haemophilus parainfluenzae]